MMRHLVLAAVSASLLAGSAVAESPPAAKAAIARAVADPRRSEANRARDIYRHPIETLSFFGVAPGQTVIEYSPGGAGWYTEILGSLLKGNGRYIPLSTARGAETTTRMLAAKAEQTGPVTLALLDPAAGTSTVPAGSADVLLTFRNVHNLLFAGDAAAAGAFKAFHAALKPGGTLGVVDHRLPEGRASALEQKSGYLKRSTVVRLATAAGFKLTGESEINANPRDTADWPQGVWTLPPVLALKDVDREKYLAIGESDRMTLRFVKPE